MYLIVGLGNPGNRYAHTRHNVGFDTVGILADRHGIAVRKIKHKALIGEGQIGGEGVILITPQTFMNLSGETVLSVCRYYDTPMERLVVIYDDVDTALGRLRIRPKGSAGTHNGMRHIIYMLGREDFPRVRVGIGKPPEHIPLHAFVTTPFQKEERRVIAAALEGAADAVETIVEQGVERAMNTYNGQEAGSLKG